MCYTGKGSYFLFILRVMRAYTKNTAIADGVERNEPLTGSH